MRRKRRELEQARMAGAGEVAAGAASRSRAGKSWPQRSLPLRLRQEIQEVPRRVSHHKPCVEETAAPAERSEAAVTSNADQQLLSLL